MSKQLWRFREDCTSGVSIKWAQSATYNILATFWKCLQSMSREVACWCFLCFRHFSFPSRLWKLTRKVVEVQCFRLFGELHIIQSFCFQVKLVSRWFIGKDSNQEKQVQDHLQIFKNRVDWSSRQCHSIAFLTFVILKAMSFNCFSYSQVKILLFGRVKMVKASKKGEAINTCYDKSKNDIMIHDPWSSYSV